MRKLLIAVMAMVTMFWFTTPTHATLLDRGGGLIYDDVLNITWLQDANYSKTSGYSATGLMTWSQATTWAANLVYGGYSDWRLPTTVDGPFGFADIGYDGTTLAGYNITTSEMGYMYYENLGNKGFYAKDGTNPQPGWGLSNTGPFLNLQPDFYWSGTEYSTDPDSAWYFFFGDGYQSIWNKQGLPVGGGTATFDYAWAVRPGDVAVVPPPPPGGEVPEPATLLLLGSGLIGLAGYGRKKFFKK